MTNRGGWLMGRTFSPKAPKQSPRPADPPPMPSEWEMMIRGHGLNARDIGAVIAAVKNGRGEPIREWVRRHYKSRYVPTRILEAMGIMEGFD